MPLLPTSVSKTGGTGFSREPLQRLGELRALAEEYQVPQIQQDKPGLFMKTVNFLSRPEFAVAGAFDELRQGNSIFSAIKRFGSELAGNGQQEDWTRILEKMGVGTITLGDMVPLLEGTWVGQAGTRGLAGLALGIATDPLTYIFSPFGVGQKLAAKGSIFSLTGRGERARTTLGKTVTDALEGGVPLEKVLKSDEALKLVPELTKRHAEVAVADLLKAGTPVPKHLSDLVDDDYLKFIKGADPETVRIRNIETRGIAWENLVDEEFIHRAQLGELGQMGKLVSKRGLGMRVPGTGIAKHLGALEDPWVVSLFPTEKIYSSVRNMVGRPIFEAMKRADGPLRRDWLGGAVNFGLASRRMVRGTFSPFAKYADDFKVIDGKLIQTEAFSATERFRAIRLHKASMRASGSIRGRMLRQVRELTDVYRRLQKKDPDLDKKFYSIREGTHTYEVTRKGNNQWDVKKGKKWEIEDLTDEQRKVYDATADLADKAGNTLVSFGVLDPAQFEKFAGKWFSHNYRNVDDVRKFHEREYGQYKNTLASDFTEKRVFDTYEDSVLRSQSRNLSDLDQVASGREGSLAITPVLEPDYDVMTNFSNFAQQYADSIGRKAWREQAVAEFGEKIIKRDVHAIYNLSKRPRSTAREEAAIEAVMTGNAVGLAAKIMESMRTGAADMKDFAKAFVAVGIVGKRFSRELNKLTPKYDKLFDERAALLGKRSSKQKTLDDLLRADAEGLPGRDRALRIESRIADANERISEIDELVVGVEREISDLADKFAKKVKPDLQQSAREFSGLRDLEKSFGDDWMEEANIPHVIRGKIGSGEDTLMAKVNQVMENLSDNGRRTMLHDLAMKADNPAQYSSILARLDDKYVEYMPTFRFIRDGDSEAWMSKIYGDGATYLFKRGGVYGEGVHIPKVVVEEIDRAPSSVYAKDSWKDFHGVLRGYDKATNFWKRQVYINPIWLSSFTRDIYSSASFAALDVSWAALNPSRAWKAQRLLSVMRQPAMAGQLRKKGAGKITLGGTTYDVEELAEIMSSMGLRQTHEAIGQQIELGRVVVKGRRKRKFRSHLAPEYKDVRADLGDNIHAVMLTMTHMDRGMSPIRAAERAREYIFDYSLLSGVEKEVIKRFIPFYTFTRKNIELQVRQLMRNPGRQINQVRAFRHANEDKEFMAKWDSEALGVRLNRDSKELVIINGIDLPMRNLDAIWNGGVGSSGMRILGMMNPILKTPLELATGKDFFTGQDLVRTKDQTLGHMVKVLPKPVQRWMGWKVDYDDAGRPTYTVDARKHTLLVKSWAFSRFFSTSNRQYRDYLKDGATLESIGSVILDLTTGLRTKRIELSSAQEQVARIRIKQYIDELTRRGVVRDAEVPFRTTEGAEFP